jgi:hypothetical protein
MNGFDGFIGVFFEKSKDDMCSASSEEPASRHSSRRRISRRAICSSVVARDYPFKGGVRKICKDTVLAVDALLMALQAFLL